MSFYIFVQKTQRFCSEIIVREEDLIGFAYFRLAFFLNYRQVISDVAEMFFTEPTFKQMHSYNNAPSC